MFGGHLMLYSTVCTTACTSNHNNVIVQHHYLTATIPAGCLVTANWSHVISRELYEALSGGCHCNNLVPCRLLAHAEILYISTSVKFKYCMQRAYLLSIDVYILADGIKSRILLVVRIWCFTHISLCMYMMQRGGVQSHRNCFSIVTSILYEKTRNWSINRDCNAIDRTSMRQRPTSNRQTRQYIVHLGLVRSCLTLL